MRTKIIASERFVEECDVFVACIDTHQRQTQLKANRRGGIDDKPAK